MFRFAGLSRTKRIVLTSFFGAASAVTAGSVYANWLHANRKHETKSKIAHDVPTIENSSLFSREEHLRALQSKQFDILVIGGGATGAGVALDAVSRGFKVAMVERDDFSSGTSSRSTKLIHGGVRYLEKAFKTLDMGQVHLVREALTERKHLLHISPHLSRPLPIIVPFYQNYLSLMLAVPYYWMGVKMYDLFSGEGLLEPSFWISKREAQEKFPMIRHEGLKGGMVYYDGQHNDSRMNVCIALTAAAYGANIANHVEVISLVQDANNKITGVNVKDNLTGHSWTINAKVVVNATGPFCDGIRRMQRGVDVKDMVAGSSGVHVVLPDRFSPKGMGLIIPNTPDGRVLFLLPWEGSTLAGTTDSSSVITALPRPHEEEINFITEQCSKYLSADVRAEDVDAAWSGIRPLAASFNTGSSTASISRDHITEVSPTGLVTITGGKWTTYRSMAEGVLDRIIQENPGLGGPNIQPCHTKEIRLIGAHGFSLGHPTSLLRLGFSENVADHLAHNYGDKCFEVADIAAREDRKALLAYGYPFIEAEVLYACRHEYAATAIDVLARRTRLAFLNNQAAISALPRVVALMAAHYGWSSERRLNEYFRAMEFLETMNREGTRVDMTDTEQLKLIDTRVRTLFDFSPVTESELVRLKRAFDEVDTDRDRKVQKSDVYKVMKLSGLFGIPEDSPETVSRLSDTALPDFVKEFLSRLRHQKEQVEWQEFMLASAAVIGRGKMRSNDDFARSQSPPTPRSKAVDSPHRSSRNLQQQHLHSDIANQPHSAPVPDPLDLDDGGIAIGGGAAAPSPKKKSKRSKKQKAAASKDVATTAVSSSSSDGKGSKPDTKGRVRPSDILE